MCDNMTISNFVFNFIKKRSYSSYSPSEGVDGVGGLAMVTISARNDTSMNAISALTIDCVLSTVESISKICTLLYI